MRALALLVVVATTFAAFPHVIPSTQAAPGDTIAHVLAPIGSWVSVSIAFDGERFHYMNYGDPVLYSYTLQCTGSTCTPTLVGANIVHHATTGQTLYPDALSYDAGRDVLWGFYNGAVYQIRPGDAAATPVFTASCCWNLNDGIAYDGSDDTIWLSNDASWEVHHYRLDGTLIETVQVSTLPSWPSGCGNSGLAVGGEHIYFGTAHCGTIYRWHRPSNTGESFASPGGRDEDLECDPITFAPRAVMWSKDAYNNIATAFEIEAGTCGLGGYPSATAAADAIGLAGSVAAQDVSLQIMPVARARTAGGESSGALDSQTLPEGLGAVGVLQQEARAEVTDRSSSFAGSSEASSTVVSVEIPGVLTADVVTARSASTVADGVASSTGEGSIIRGLSVAGSAPVDVAWPLSQRIELPEGRGYVAIFEEASGGDGATSTELSVTAIRVVLQGDVEADIRIAEAWSGLASHGGFSARPANEGMPIPPSQEDVEALVEDALEQLPEPPSAPTLLGAGPSGARAPWVPWPAEAWGPLPGDSISQSTPAGSVQRSRAAYPYGSGGYVWSSTSVYVPAAGVTLTLSEGRDTGGYSGPGYAYESRSASYLVHAQTPAGAVSATNMRWTQAYDSQWQGGHYRSYNDDMWTQASASTLAGQIMLTWTADQEEYDYDYGAWGADARGWRYQEVTVGFRDAVGQWRTLWVELDYANVPATGEEAVIARAWLDGQQVAAHRVDL